MKTAQVSQPQPDCEMASNWPFMTYLEPLSYENEAVG